MTVYTFPEPQMIETNGVSLEVFVAGKPGKPIVLCHGWPEHAFSYRYQVQPLVDAGYHVILPNQRGYGHSTEPDAVEDYDMNEMTGDLAGLLDHFGYDKALFVGHDWGAIIVWAMAMIHKDRVEGIINMSVPFMDRGEEEWVGAWEKLLGPDFYIVHFNRNPGVADKVFEENTDNFLRGIFRTENWHEPPGEPEPGMPLINVALSKEERGGRLMMSEEEFSVFVKSFGVSGFTGGLNWYRNFTRNWGILGDYEQKVDHPALMIHGKYDMVPASDKLPEFVPNVEVHTLECGHWIQQEKPDETNALMMEWLGRNYPA